MVFRRKTRKIEAKQVCPDNTDRGEDVRNKLGISSTAPAEKVIFELNKVKGKPSLRKDLGLIDEDFEQFGME